ncbi:MAG TPA: plasmid partitioning protein RepA [Paracoccus sp. (in: a-proteobacteria)]|uniref:plasmid partitioning protein RepA n=1 Tax=Paracoccus sp. TaxID=267 RepID=UPI002CDCD697|nr:plasmid partitioning protein RepA [Paracoccus sp. (in: a-proteobacteria)]HWL57103.1 plasmid partitioning protein RepA [Paracoccus sp. (in: a-proteobacteria)]
MNEHNPVRASRHAISIDQISAYADKLARSLDEEMRKAYRPTERKSLRLFSVAELVELTGIPASTIRSKHNGGAFPEVETDSRGHRFYTAEQIDQIRTIMAQGKNGAQYRPGRRSGDEMQVISVVNFKGGSTKTTTTIHLAQRYALRGYRVLVIDMDPQASLSTFFGYRPELDFDLPGELTIYDAIRYDDPEAGMRRAPINEVIRKTYFHNLDMCPASLMLSEYETETANALSQGGRSTHSLFAIRLGEALQVVKDDYDIVLIDCPPQLGFITLTSLSASTGLIVTVVPGMLDIASMSQFLKLATETMQVISAKTGLRSEWDFVKFLISRFEPNDGPQMQMAGYLRSILGSDVLFNPTLKSTAISDAGMTQETIYEVDGRSMVKSTLDRALTSMNAVAGEIEDIIQTSWGR